MLNKIARPQSAPADTKRERERGKEKGIDEKMKKRRNA
jgi:hypothetical protein